jgi:hypothetical protein
MSRQRRGGCRGVIGVRLQDDGKHEVRWPGATVSVEYPFRDVGGY